MLYKKGVYLTLIVLLISGGTSSVYARTFDRIVAYVNDDVVTKRELDVLVNQRSMELQQVYRFSEREALNEAERQRSRIVGQTYPTNATFRSSVDVEDYCR